MASLYDDVVYCCTTTRRVNSPSYALENFEQIMYSMDMNLNIQCIIVGTTYLYNPPCKHMCTLNTYFNIRVIIHQG